MIGHFLMLMKTLHITGDFDNDCSSNPNWVGDVGMVGYAFFRKPWKSLRWN